MRATRPASSARTWFVPRRLRLRLVAFLVRMWLLKACPHLNLPEAVLRNRLAAARLVLILGMCLLRRFVSLLTRAVALATLSFLLVSASKPLIQIEIRAGSKTVSPITLGHGSAAAPL